MCPDYLTEDEFKSYFPTATADVVRRSTTKSGQTSLPANHPGPVAKLEPDPGNGAVGAVQIQGPAPARFLIRVTSRRKRLLDEDNLCEKYVVDCCRFSSLIPGDGPGQTKIEVRQEKVEPGAAEETLVEIFEV